MAEVESVAPVVKAEQVKRLVATLRANMDKVGDPKHPELRGWMTAKQLAEAMGKATASWERKVRAIASVAAPQVVSYPGSPGYKWAGACTVAEIEHCIAALKAQGKDMIRRANVYCAMYFRREPKIVRDADQFSLPLAT